MPPHHSNLSFLRLFLHYWKPENFHMFLPPSNPIVRIFPGPYLHWQPSTALSWDRSIQTSLTALLSVLLLKLDPRNKRLFPVWECKSSCVPSSTYLLVSQIRAFWNLQQSLSHLGYLLKKYKALEEPIHSCEWFLQSGLWANIFIQLQKEEKKLLVDLDLL